MSIARSTVLFLCALVCHAADADRDGIPDEWEINGVTLTLPGGVTRHIDLASLGASPRHKDVIVWITWMKADGHSHMPTANRDRRDDSGIAIEQEPLGRIKDAFRNAPVDNLDGTRGINLIILYAADGVAETPVLGTTDQGTGNYIWSDFERLKSESFPTGPADIGRAFRFCAFIHQMGGEAVFSSGLARGIPGHDFLVSLGGRSNNTGSSDEQAGTFMHELGHVLGLRHGGTDDIQYKPNYLSAMNYLFQVTGLMHDDVLGRFDYSRFAFNFDERVVDGRKGVSQSAIPELVNYGSAEVCSDLATYRYFPSLRAPIRWDCTDNDPDPGVHAQDVNRDGTVQLLLGSTDWPNIILAPASPVGGGVQVTRLVHPRAELDVRHVARLMSSIVVSRISAVRRPNGIHVGWSRVPLEAVVAYEVLRYQPGIAPIVIRQTNKAEFLDASAKPGIAYSYSVRLVVSGFSGDVVERLTQSVVGVLSLSLSDIRSVIPRGRVISDTLLRSLQSRRVSPD